jgi:hypothetical protein
MITGGIGTKNPGAPEGMDIPERPAMIDTP